LKLRSIIFESDTVPLLRFLLWAVKEADAWESKSGTAVTLNWAGATGKWFGS